MEFRLNSYSLVFNFSIVSLKSKGFMMRNLQLVLALILADLFVFRISAISPKVEPFVSILIVFPSICTSTSPY